MRLDGVPNVRDLGGLKTKDGMEFRKGLLYRSAGFNNNAPHRMVTNEAGKVSRGYYGKGRERLKREDREYAVKTLGIRTDLDLRTDGECHGMSGSPLGPEVKWVHIPSMSYAGLFSTNGIAAFKKSFKLFLDERNYPIAFHCIAGADRTGTLAYVIEALCGVSDDDLLLDWELTAFSSTGCQFSHEKRYDRLVAGFMKYPGGCTRERVEAFVREQGFTDTDMAHLRRLLLVAAVAAFAAEMPPDVKHRAEVRAALADPARRDAAIEAGLKDEDTLVRRHALYLAAEKCAGDRAASEALAKPFLSDTSAAVRVVAKAACRKGGIYRDNKPMSMAADNDHATIRIQTARPKGGVFAFKAPLGEYEAVELWFGKPTKDLYVWMNEVYLVQFDYDLQRGHEFRLDATKEMNGPLAANTVVVKDGSGKIVNVGFTAEALSWK